MDYTDQKAINLTKAIGLQEGGGKFAYNDHSGDAGTSKGAYQWQPNNFENAAKQYNLDPTDFSPKNQNRVAYAQVKSRLDAGLKPWEVAAEWNSGNKDNWKDHSGDTTINGQKIHYDTPAYVNAVKNYYSKLAGGTDDTTDQTDTPNTDQPVEPTAPVKTPVSFGQKVLNVAGDVTGQRGLGEDVAAAIGGNLYADKFNAVAKADQDYLTTILRLRNEAAKKGDESSVSHFQNLIKNYKTTDGQSITDVFPSLNKTTAQVLGDVASSAIGIAGGALIPGAGGVGGRIAAAGLTGGALGLSGGVGNGDTSFDSLAKDTGYGTIGGVATAGLLEGIGGAIRGTKNFINPKTAEEILSTPAKDVANLSPRQQKLWYTNQAKEATSVAQEATAAAEKAKFNTTQQLNNDIKDLQSKIGNTTAEKADTLKAPSKNLLKEMSHEYVDKTEEAFSKAASQPMSTNLVNENEAGAFLHDKFPSSPENPNSIADEILKDLKFTGNEETGKNISLQDIHKAAKEYIQQMNKSSLGGNKTFSASDYHIMQKYGALMDLLENKGVDLSEANKMWKAWSPVKNQIVSQIRPFDKTTGKTPFARTLIRATTSKPTAQQAVAKLEAQKFISTLESKLKLEAGSLTKDTEELVNNMDEAKLKKVNIQQLTSDIKQQIKLDKEQVIKTVGLKKYDATSKELRNKSVMKALERAGIFLGASTVVGGAVGAYKAITK